MLPSLHRLRLHDAAPVGGKAGKNKKKVHNPQRKAKHDAKVAAAEAQRAKVAALITETLDDDARREIMKQLVGCPPYGVAMSDLDALIATDSRFAALSHDDGVWKELFPALMAKREALDVRYRRPLAAWLPRMDAFERSMAAGEFASWWDAYSVLCKFLQLHELMDGWHPRWWPELVMYESDGEYEYPWVDSDGNEDEVWEHRDIQELDDYHDWRSQHSRVVNMDDMDIDEVESVLHKFSSLNIGAMLEASPPPAGATVHKYISAVWTVFASAVARAHSEDEAFYRTDPRIAAHFYGGGLGDLVFTLANNLTTEQLLRHYEDVDAAPLDPDLLDLRAGDRRVHPLGARILRERKHIFDVWDALAVRRYAETQLGIEVVSPEFASALLNAIYILEFHHGTIHRSEWPDF